MKIEIKSTVDKEYDELYSNLRTLDQIIAANLANSPRIINLIDYRSKVFEHYYKNYIVAVIEDNTEMRVHVMKNIKNMYDELINDLKEFKGYWEDHKDCDGSCNQKDKTLN
ncbi:MAG: hypothetical protein WC753_04715 [Candidatus Gracilibacteria bacterium]|jgi:hypothetical protein